MDNDALCDHWLALWPFLNVMTDSYWLDAYYIIGGSALFSLTVLWPVFVIVSMLKIEKKIVSSGKPRPCQWDPIWGRAFFYAWTLALPTKNYSELENKLLDPKDVLPYANILDRFLAFFLFISVWIFVLTAIVGWALSIQ